MIFKKSPSFEGLRISKPWELLVSTCKENSTQEFYAFLIGSLLGDGSIRKTANCYDESASDAHKDYLQWKRDFLNRYVPCGDLYAVYNRPKETGKTHRCWRFISSTCATLKAMRGIWYPCGQKVVPIEFVDQHFNALSFAIWYCDDGHRTGPRSWGRGAYLSTCAFSVADIGSLVRVLADKIGIKGDILQNSDRQPVIRFLGKEWPKIEVMLRHFSLPGMGYKFADRSLERVQGILPKKQASSLDVNDLPLFYE